MINQLDRPSLLNCIGKTGLAVLKLLTLAIMFMSFLSSIGCQNHPSQETQSQALKDGPPDIMLDSSTIKAAEPQYEPRSRYGNHSPYTVLGKTYEVIEKGHPPLQEGIASWYGTKFHGKRTSSWERYDMLGMTAAHRSLPLPTYVKVTNLKNKRSTIVKVNDRGPFHSDRLIDLSYAAAVKLGFARHGTAPVRVEVIPMSSLKPNNLSQPASIHDPNKAPDRNTAFANTISQDKPIDKDLYKKGNANNSNSLTSSGLKATAEKLYIQVGAYSDAQRAIQLQTQLQEWVNFPVTIDRSPRNALYRVQIGPLRSSVQAQAINQLLAKEFDILEPMLVWN